MAGHLPFGVHFFHPLRSHSFFSAMEGNHIVHDDDGRPLQRPNRVTGRHFYIEFMMHSESLRILNPSRGELSDCDETVGFHDIHEGSRLRCNRIWSKYHREDHDACNYTQEGMGME